VEEPYQNVTRDDTSTSFRLIIFILVANIIGTNIFIPHYFTLEFAWEIWTWSMIANIVFILTMTFALIIPLKLHSINGNTIQNGLLCGVLVYIGYMISWFFVCNLSDQFDMEYYSFVFHGYWGAFACMFTSMIMMNNSSKKHFTGKHRFSCPSCYSGLTVPKSYSGGIRCVRCMNILDVHTAGGVVVASLKGIE